jgi:glycosyltransferase involved in cell wall biosynthesis
MMTNSAAPLRIAQVAPLYESVPPKYYGGTERVVSYLTEELVRQGHDVTLFASGDSVTRAKLVSPCPRALRLDEECVDQLAPHVLMLEQVFRDPGRFDILHFHCDYLHYPLSRRQNCPHVTTLHGRLDLPELPALYREYAGVPVVSISDAQRAPLPWCNWRATVYHGLPEDLHTFRERPGDYLAFLGRISPEKGVDQAIAIAQRTGMKLKIAAKVAQPDRTYFQSEIRPLFQQASSLVEFVGEIGGKDKDEFLGNAYALLFPINWPEPFGLVMIEALACGTPVVAYRRGSVPEVLEDGVTGFVVENLDEAAGAVGRVATLSRQRCRQVFEQRFSAARMARDYLKVYRRLLAETRQGDKETRRQGDKKREPRARPPSLPVPLPPRLSGTPGLANGTTAGKPSKLGKSIEADLHEC